MRDAGLTRFYLRSFKLAFHLHVFCFQFRFDVLKERLSMSVMD